MSFTPEQVAELQKKLNPAHVKPPKQHGPKGDYIEGWHAIAEANRIFGFDAWSYQILKCECAAQNPRLIGKQNKDGWGVTYVATVRTEVGGTVREDVGAGHGYDTDLGIAHESAVKEAVTDALKRCLRTYGNPFGLALYDKTQANVGIDVDWSQERDELTRLLNGCQNIDAVVELWRTERMQKFIKQAPQEFSSPVIKIKEAKKNGQQNPFESAA